MLVWSDLPHVTRFASLASRGCPALLGTENQGMSFLQFNCIERWEGRELLALFFPWVLKGSAETSANRREADDGL